MAAMQEPPLRPPAAGRPQDARPPSGAWFVRRKEAVVAHALTRLGHPVFHSCPPREVVRRLLVCLRSSLVAVRLVGHEARRVVGRLEDVETEVPRLPDGTLMVGPNGLDEIRH